MKTPKQIILGGKIAEKVWKKEILPMLQDRSLSVRDIAKILGVSPMTVSRWRSL